METYAPMRVFVSLQESLGSLRINVEFGKKPELQVNGSTGYTWRHKAVSRW